jgi:hypothetical protein
VIPGEAQPRTVVRFAEMANALADELAVPRISLIENNITPVSRAHLTDVLDSWHNDKMGPGGWQTRHQRSVRRHWT